MLSVWGHYAQQMKHQDYCVPRSSTVTVWGAIRLEGFERREVYSPYYLAFLADHIYHKIHWKTWMEDQVILYKYLLIQEQHETMFLSNILFDTKTVHEL